MGLAAVVGFLFIVYVVLLANRLWCSKARWAPAPPRCPYSPAQSAAPAPSFPTLSGPPITSLYVQRSPIALLLLQPLLSEPRPRACTPASLPKITGPAAQPFLASWGS